MEAEPVDEGCDVDFGGIGSLVGDLDGERQADLEALLEGGFEGFATLVDACGVVDLNEERADGQWVLGPQSVAVVSRDPVGNHAGFRDEILAGYCFTDGDGAGGVGAWWLAEGNFDDAVVEADALDAGAGGVVDDLDAGGFGGPGEVDDEVFGEGVAKAIGERLCRDGEAQGGVFGGRGVEHDVEPAAGHGAFADRPCDAARERAGGFAVA